MSGSDLEQMYQEVILEAAKNPHGKEHFAPDLASENASHAAETTVQTSHEYCTPGESHQFNPTCGDEATIHAEVSDAEPYTIERLVWDGHGCSISQASLSVMVDLVEGKTVDEAMKLAETFHKLMESRGKGLNDEQAEESLEDGIVFQGVSQYPMRIKCALLGWEGMKDAVAKKEYGAEKSYTLQRPSTVWRDNERHPGTRTAGVDLRFRDQGLGQR